MDMWGPYIQATRAQVPAADEKSVFAPFHVMVQIGKGVDTVRNQELRDLMPSSEETLRDSACLWLCSWENVLAQLVEMKVESR